MTLGTCGMSRVTPRRTVVRSKTKIHMKTDLIQYFQYVMKITELSLWIPSVLLYWPGMMRI